MRMNKKGFTVIELVMSFVFSSILAITLFGVIVSYRSRQTDASIETELLAFKSHLIMDIQDDIQLRGLKDIDYCTYYDDATNKEVVIPRCVNMRFNDDTSKDFKIDFDHMVDEIKNDNGTITTFDYDLPCIIYGDIKYNIPDAASVYIDDDYILTTTGMDDGLETGTSLYKINFNLKHSDLDADINVSLVANGTLKAANTEGNYTRYSIGDRVLVQIHGKKDLYVNGVYYGPSQLKFRVIKDSNKKENSLYLLYDDNYDSELILNSTPFNVLGIYSNRYGSSTIKGKIHEIEMRWSNADEIRLITTEEIARVASLSPQYRGVDSSDVSLASLPSSKNWLLYSNGNNFSYWTMSDKLVTGDNNGKKVWYVNSQSKTLTSDLVDQSHAIRPIIVLRKSYVLEKIS